MRRLIALTICFMFVGMGSVLAETELQEHTWEINIDSHLGGASYEEESGNVKSDWDAFWYEIIMELGSYDKNELEGGLNLGFFVAPTEQEAWFLGGALYQTNDMDLWGLDLGGEIGWAINFTEKFILTPIAAYGYRWIRFSRTNFNILGIIVSREIIDEDYDIHHIDLGARANYELSDDWNLFARASYGFVVSNTADNSLLGEIDGDGGYIVKTELGLDYAFSDDFNVTFGGFVELEHLEGGTSGSVIWPDNDLNVYGATIGVRYLF